MSAEFTFSTCPLMESNLAPTSVLLRSSFSTRSLPTTDLYKAPSDTNLLRVSSALAMSGGCI